MKDNITSIYRSYKEDVSTNHMRNQILQYVLTRISIESTFHVRWQT